MPIGKYVTKQEKTRVLELLAQGLAPKVVSIRTGLHLGTIYRTRKEVKEGK